MTQHLLDVSKKYGLNLSPMSAKVYSVNNNKKININRFERDLNNCILVVADTDTYEKDNTTGVYSLLSKVFYIILGASEKDLAHKYLALANKEKGPSILTEYIYNPNSDNRIDTIYSAEELGRV